MALQDTDSQPNFVSSLSLDDNYSLLADTWQGRTEEQSQLLVWLADEKTQLLGIEGLSGFGKSTLAAKIYEARGDSASRPYGIVRKFWAGVSQHPDFTLLARRVLLQLGQLTPEAVEAIAESHLIDTTLGCLRDERYLLAIDNLEMLLHPDGRWRDAVYEQFFTSWLECDGKSVILVTTQVKPQLPTGGKLYWQRLNGLRPDEGAALLQQLGIQGTDTQLQEFSQSVEGHPLLLKLVAGFLNDEEGPNPHLRYLHELWLSEFSTPPLQRGDFGRLGRLLEASFNRLSPKVQTILLNLSVYRRPFNQAAATAQSPEEEVLPQDLRQLVQRSLLQEQTDQNGRRWFQFHSFVLAYLRGKTDDLSVAHQQAIRYYLSITKEPPWQSIDDVIEYLEIFYHWWELRRYTLAFDTLRICDDFLALQGFSAIRVQLYEQLIQVWQPNVEEQSKLMDCLMRLSNAHFALGQHFQATERYRQLLKIAREANAREWEAFALGGLGSVYLLTDQAQNATDLFKQWLEICRQISDRRGQAKALNNLGSAYNALGQFQEAIVFSGQSLEIYREIGEMDGEATALIHLGYAYNSLGQYQRAIEYYQQSLEIHQKNGLRLGEADALTSLGNAYYSLKQYQQAIDFYERALAIEREIGVRRGEVNALGGLGRVYRALRQYPKAIECYRQSLEVARKVGDRQGEATALGNLGNAYYFLRQYHLAIDYCQQQLKIAIEIGDRQGEANSLGNLGIAHQSLGQYQLAIDYYNSSLVIKREISDRRGEANSLFNLGNVLAKQKQYSAAITAYENARALYEEIGLHTDALDANNAIEHLASVVAETITQSDSSALAIAQPTGRLSLSRALLYLLQGWYQRLRGVKKPSKERPRRRVHR